MALATTHRASAYDNADKTDTYYETASISPTASRWLVADVMMSYTSSPPDPTISGLIGGSTLTWSTESSTVLLGDRRLVRAYAWTGASPGTGTLRFTISGSANGCAWVVYELSSDVNDTDPFVQTQTADSDPSQVYNITVTLSSFAYSGNRPLMFHLHQQNEGSSAEAGWTEVAPADVYGSGPNNSIQSTYNPDTADTSAYASWSTQGYACALASEVNMEAAGGGGGVADPMGMSGFFGA